MWAEQCGPGHIFNTCLVWMHRCICGTTGRPGWSCELNSVALVTFVLYTCLVWMHNCISGTTGRSGRSELGSVAQVTFLIHAWCESIIASVVQLVTLWAGQCDWPHFWYLLCVNASCISDGPGRSCELDNDLDHIFITCLVWMLIASVWDQVKVVSRTMMLTTVLIPTFSEC